MFCADKSIFLRKSIWLLFKLSHFIYQCFINRGYLIDNGLGCANIMFSKIIPQSLKVFGIEKGFYHCLAVAFGKSIGILLIPLSFQINEKTYLIFSFGFASVLLTISFGFIISKYRNFRVKAISQILRKNKTNYVQNS